MAAVAEQLRQPGVSVTAGTAEEAEARRVAGLIKFADPSGIPSEIFYGPLVLFYLRTPSGFNMEYGWGAREVDDSKWQVQTHAAGSIWGHQGSL